MKKMIVKITGAAIILLAAAWITNVQTAQASAAQDAKTKQVLSLEEAKASVGVTCTGWTKIGEGSECTCYYQGTCIGNRYWDKERRACGLPGTSWWWYEYRNTNYRTAGPSC